LQEQSAQLNDQSIDTRVDIIRNAIVLNVRFPSRKYIVCPYFCATVSGDILEFATTLNFVLPAQRVRPRAGPSPGIPRKERRLEWLELRGNELRESHGTSRQVNFTSFAVE